MTDQATLILDHLLREGSITPMEALAEYQCLRLAARINDLRARGFAIETKIEHGPNKKHWARYTMVAA